MVVKKDNTQYLTQEGFDKLLVEKTQLIDEKIPATLERLKEAISQWDISENAEYDTAMSEKELIEGYTYTIVWTAEVNVLEGTISLESPMWIALNGKKKWDTAVVKAPSRKYSVKVVNVK